MAGRSPSRSTPGWEIPERPHWDAVAHVLPQVLDLLLAAEEGTVLSVNVPDRPAAELGPLREAKLTEFGMATITVRHHDEVDAAVLRATAEDLATEPDPESDIALLAAGHPTVTRLASVADQPGVLQVAGADPPPVCDRANSPHARSRDPCGVVGPVRAHGGRRAALRCADRRADLGRGRTAPVRLRVLVDQALEPVL